MERAVREKWLTLVENCGTMVRFTGALRTDVDPRILLYVGFLQNCDMYSGEQDYLMDKDDEVSDDDSAAAMHDFHIVWEKPWADIGAVRCAVCGGPPPRGFKPCQLCRQASFCHSGHIRMMATDIMQHPEFGGRTSLIENYITPHLQGLDNTLSAIKDASDFASHICTICRVFLDDASDDV